ncbi:uncharacterized protein LOC126334675 isoform X1 [Schistocerca gregaria]|uniref:uncharacterized protein LOC126334675 isoform X1 n=1 Tax=Schistocerca gregaria TaxID=7010 RepID=UPI00211EF1F6|nr:uncharacterized protein LOC126334675 isoform X1 [Schistocerca gregaria]
MSVVESNKEGGDAAPATLLQPTSMAVAPSLMLDPALSEMSDELSQSQSLFSAYTYHEDSDDAYSQVLSELDLVTKEQWQTPALAPMVGVGMGVGMAPATWQLTRPPPFCPEVIGDAPPVAPEAYTQDGWCDPDMVDGVTGGGALVATPHGTINLRLRDRVRVEMTVDQAIRIVSLKNNILLALSSSGSSSALIHPNGCVYQYGSRVEILANDANGNYKLAKMWYKGVSFTSEKCALVYLVDAAGTRTTTDVFSDMSNDFSLSVFYDDSCHGLPYIHDCIATLQRAQHWVTDEGIFHWMINSVHISQTQDGLVRVARHSNKYQMRTSPANGTASLTTPFVHCTASLGQSSHLFVKRGERRMHYDGSSFIVRNAGHSAGFDEKNQLKVY